MNKEEIKVLRLILEMLHDIRLGDEIKKKQWREAWDILNEMEGRL